MKHYSRYIAAAILALEAIYLIYTTFFVYSYTKSYIPLVYVVLFISLAYLTLTHFQNRLVQWPAIILSMLIGFGGFLGAGWLSALILAIIYITGRSK